MTTAVDTIATFCRDSLPNCPVPLLRRLVVEAAREFGRKTSGWKWWVPTQTIVSGTSDYSLVSTQPAQSVIDDILSAKVNGTNIYPYSDSATTPAVDQHPYGGLTVNGEITAASEFQNTTYHRALRTSITLVPPPSSIAGTSLDVQIRLIPQIGATVIPDLFWDEHSECIENYVKWKAMTRVKEKFSDPVMGEFHHGQYELMANAAKVKIQIGNVSPRHRNVPCDFA